MIITTWIKYVFLRTNFIRQADRMHWAAKFFEKQSTKINDGC